MGGVADVPEVHAASIFRVGVSRMSECIFISTFWFNRRAGGRVGTEARSGSVGVLNGEIYTKMALLRATECSKIIDV
jgi:hypothetical protein